MKFNLVTGLFLTLTELSTIFSQGCSNPYRRKEIREISLEEFNRYAAAVKALSKKPSDVQGLSILDKFSKLHASRMGEAHGNAKFFPWHRYFIQDFENELQKVDPSVHLIYWDWTKDYEEPHNSIILSNTYMGTHGVYEDESYCVVDGQFANLQVNYPTPHCLQRHYLRYSKVPPFMSPLDLHISLNTEKFSTFSDQFEPNHGLPHIGIGGYTYDFAMEYSPNDPIFYIHHTFVDLIFSEWLLRHPNFTFEGEAYFQNVTKNDYFYTWKVPINSTFSTTHDRYCYSYPRFQYTPPATLKSSEVTKDTWNHLLSLDKDQAIQFLEAEKKRLPVNRAKTSNFMITKSDDLPSSWIKMMHYNETSVRLNELKSKRFIDLVNNVLA